MSTPAPVPSNPVPVPIEVRRHPVVAEIARRLEGRCGVPAGSRVVVGLSGGADSVTLLLAAVALRGRQRPWISAALDPVAVHVNHGLRETAADDEKAAVALAERFAVPIEVRRVSVGDVTGNVAAAARALRYAAMVEVADAVESRYVAVAHHADDQLETMLMALGRGAGLEGLSAMEWSRPLTESVALVRPMLGLRKHDAEELCRVAGLSWQEDPTNRDATTARGRLRRDVLPVFEALWPDAALRAAHTADALAAAGSALERQLAGVFGDATQRSWERAPLRGVLGAAGSRAAAEAFVAAGLRRAALRLCPQCADELGQVHLLPAADAIVGGDPQPRSFDWPCRLRLEVTAWQVRLELVDRR